MAQVPQFQATRILSPSHKRSRRARRALRLLLIVVFAMVLVFPLYWMILNSLQPGARFNYPPTFLPQSGPLEAYTDIFDEMQVWLLNSALVATSTALLTVAVSTWAAYALSRFRTRGVRTVGYITLMTQMMPPVILMIPLFLLFRDLGLVDNLLGLVVAHTVFVLPVTTWMIKSVIDAVPVELEQAAFVDGCSRMSALYRIVLPLTAPGIGAAAIFAFLESWQEFLFTRTLISSPDNWVASIGVASFFGWFDTPWDRVMAGAVLFTIPPVILFLVVQRYFVASLAGGVKG